MRSIFLIILFTITGLVACYSDDLHDKFFHYAKYSALASCITHGNISTGLFHKGACHLNFCQDDRNKGAQIVQVWILILFELDFRWGI